MLSLFPGAFAHTEVPYAFVDAMSTALVEQESNLTPAIRGIPYFPGLRRFRLPPLRKPPGLA